MTPLVFQVTFLLCVLLVHAKIPDRWISSVVSYGNEESEERYSVVDVRLGIPGDRVKLLITTSPVNFVQVASEAPKEYLDEATVILFRPQYQYSYSWMFDSPLKPYAKMWTKDDDIIQSLHTPVDQSSGDNTNTTTTTTDVHRTLRKQMILSKQRRASSTGSRSDFSRFSDDILEKPYVLGSDVIHITGSQNLRVPILLDFQTSPMMLCEFCDGIIRVTPRDLWWDFWDCMKLSYNLLEFSLGCHSDFSLPSQFHQPFYAFEQLCNSGDQQSQESLCAGYLYEESSVRSSSEDDGESQEEEVFRYHLQLSGFTKIPYPLWETFARKESVTGDHVLRLQSSECLPIREIHPRYQCAQITLIDRANENSLNARGISYIPVHVTDAQLSETVLDGEYNESVVLGTVVIGADILLNHLVMIRRHASMSPDGSGFRFEFSLMYNGVGSEATVPALHAMYIVVVLTLFIKFTLGNPSVVFRPPDQNPIYWCHLVTWWVTFTVIAVLSPLVLVYPDIYENYSWLSIYFMCVSAVMYIIFIALAVMSWCIKIWKKSHVRRELLEPRRKEPHVVHFRYELSKLDNYFSLNLWFRFALEVLCLGVVITLLISTRPLECGGVVDILLVSGYFYVIGRVFLSSFDILSIGVQWWRVAQSVVLGLFFLANIPVLWIGFYIPFWTMPAQEIGISAHNFPPITFIIIGVLIVYYHRQQFIALIHYITQKNK